ncbi:thioredoxin-disulfide reductase [Oecophyllibacter saccharovorans]|uniref:Thioredoxin reductase n=1 Tax=Oecophyllibacter saccharovorans TaxID=2558360 RepID=A0A506UR06_9PROT|nr:thioredoxin-disulfide reductase [Oecophyllibacter saccharovorans]QDH14648.1 thioredoxin-disulfide reductase [Oecophyllibacter saccharovorans]TPW34849.1 thioredoxin-disulfide reductase [Oecophyllibacter saccharovorans]TPW35786.1 thioredoxin-disulfide reductase [Oecophyllibacter saccharovorans]
MTTVHRTDLLIVGSGPAGYTAGIYAARAALKPLLVTGLQPGGQLTITQDIENYPGFAEPVGGPWLMEQMRLQAEHMGTEIIYDLITQAELKNGPDAEGYFHLKGDSGTTYLARSVVIATGARAKWLETEAEKKFQGHGVSACATCDGFFYRGKDVAVVGGGNTAVEEALYLTHHAKNVHLIHRRDSLKAEKILQERLKANPKIHIHWNREIDDIYGTVPQGSENAPEVVSGVKLRDTENPAAAPEKLAVDGVFIAIGHIPNIGPFRDQVACDEEGYIQTIPGTACTSVTGIFAAGDIQDKIYRQAVTAAGTGCMAALEAERYLAAANRKRKDASKNV